MDNRFTHQPYSHQQRQQSYNNVDQQPPKYCLTVQQQPRKARLCSFKDKVDRRPIDPPPIVQLYQSNTMTFNDYHNSANFFLHTTLVNSNDNSDLHVANGNRTTAGSVVQSLHKLKDTNNAEGAFFIFADISIRVEGIFKLKFTLFQIRGMEVERICSIYSNPFQVYSPKSFPGMSESTDLTRIFSDQGVRIRIRKEARAATTPSMKRRRGMDQHGDSSSSTSMSTTPKEEAQSTSSFNVMSMQNLLISDPSPSSPQDLFPTRTLLPLPSSLASSSYSDSTTMRNYYYSSSSDHPPQLLPSLQQIRSPPPTTYHHHSSSTYHHHRENSPSQQ